MEKKMETTIMGIYRVKGLEGMENKIETTVTGSYRV